MSVRRSVTIAVTAFLLTAAIGDAFSQDSRASRQTFVKLLEVQELWGTEDYDAALAELRELEAEVEDRPYDLAVTQQYIAHTAVLGERDELAMPALDIALAQPDLPQSLVAELKLFYGQLSLAEEDFEVAHTMLEEWYATTENERQPSNIFSLAYANYMIKQLPRAEELIVEAIDKAKKTNNSWHRVHYQILFDQKKFDEAEGVIYELLTRDPGSDLYWRILASHYMQLEESHEALAAMAISHLQGHLTKPEDRRRLASLYAYVEVPEKSARLLETWIADESVPADAETFRRMGELWLLARERNKAKEYFLLAGDAEPDSYVYELLGSLYFEDEEWKSAYEAYTQALAAGDVDEPPRVYLLAGVSAMRAGMNEEARNSLEEARKSDEYRTQAQNLLRKMNESRDEG